MAFIVKKKIHGNEYYYLRESRRVDGKVKSICLGYLGKTKKDAEKKLKEILKAKESKKEELKKVERASEAKQVRISIEDLAIFCKRKGFVYQSGEIYGGLAGFWDFGHLGVELKNNIKKEWWNSHVNQREDIVGIDGSIMTHPEVWKASGHVDSFIDYRVRHKKTGEVFKIDAHELKNYEKDDNYCIEGVFNPMFETKVGAYSNQRFISGEDSNKVYLRPETAQLIFTNFKFVYDNARMKLPFGIAQIGKVFRNEIAPRDFLFRSREFEQMEVEYFTRLNTSCPYKIPNEKILIYSAEAQEKDEEPVKMKIKEALGKAIIKEAWHAYWLSIEFLWFKNLGANPENFRLRQHKKDELAHYATDCWDLEYNFPFGWQELEGIADRGNYDLSQHEKFSKKDLKIFDEETKQKILPQVICEPSLGVERSFLVFMFDAYCYDKKRDNIILKLHPKLAPIKAAIFPLVKRKDFEKICEKIVEDLGEEWNVVYDKSGTIGRRYARNDEIGTPFCITIDEESLKKKDVTIRHRDTTRQVRVKIIELKDILRKLIDKKLKFEEAGRLVK